MRMYFPEIYLDELVYSWLSRYFVYSGCTNNRMLLSQLFYSKSSNPSIEFIGHLNEAAEQQITQVYSMDDLILNHTMFPQYARFLTAEKRKMALTELKCYCDPHKVFTILPRNEDELWLKYCPQCAAEDRKVYGETYWHRTHQIRNMMICPIHKCKLVNSEVDVRSEKIFTFNPAELSEKDTKPKYEYNQTLIKYSQYITKIFNFDLVNDSSIPVSAIIYDAMKKSKYMRGQHRNMELFMVDFQELFTEMGVNSITSIHQIRRVILKNGTEFSAICQIAYFLDIYVNDLLYSKIEASKIQEEKESHYIRNRQAIDWKKFDVEKEGLLDKHCKAIYTGGIHESGRPERVSEKEVCRFLGVTLDGFKNLHRCQKVWQRYKESYDESNARKIVWGYKTLQSGSPDKKLYFFDLRRLTGVKKQRFPPFELVEKYSNKTIANEIFSLL